MKFILHMLDRMRPFFEHGRGRPFFRLFEAADTFFFSPADVTDGPPHVRDPLDLKRYMITVILALMPCFLFGLWNAGHRFNVVNLTGHTGLGWDLWEGAWIVLPIYIVTYVTGLFWEILFATVRKHEVNEGFFVTGFLIPLVLPPTIPLWQVAVATSFGVIIGKEIFGGTGFNVLNPALAARAYLFFAHPGQITGDSVWTKIVDPGRMVEGFSGATPLAIAAAAPAGTTAADALAQAGHTFRSMALGMEGGSIGETSLIPILIGAAILLATRLGSWRIMAGGVIGLAATAGLIDVLAGPSASPYAHLPFHYHFAMGGFAFGLVFMATDPVSGAATTAGKWVYGLLIGALAALIRIVNPAFPEGMMLAILFMNVMAPLVDYIVVQVHLRRRKAYLEQFRHA